MKFLFQVTILAILVYGGYLYYDNYVRAQPEPPPPPVSEPGPLNIVCPTCEGVGKLTYLDLRGQNHSYSCRICGFSGSRTISVPPGAHICPDCKGMGRYEIKEARRDVRGGHLIGATRCQRCAGAGVVRPQFDPGRRAPTSNM